MTRSDTLQISGTDEKLTEGICKRGKAANTAEYKIFSSGWCEATYRLPLQYVIVQVLKLVASALYPPTLHINEVRT